MFSIRINRRLLSLIGLLVILSSIPVTILLTQQQHEIRQRAAEQEMQGAVQGIVSPPLTKKVLLIIYNPVFSNGQKLHQARGWFDPVVLTDQVISAIRESTSGYLNYQVVETIERNEWPRKIDGFRYTETTYNACMSNTANCHMPDDFDFNQMWTDFTICNRVSSGTIDEVFIYSFPYAGTDEFAFKIPSDVYPYNRSTNYWLYDGRKKNIPDCNGKTVFVMGFSYEVSLGNALESYGHRIESALGLTLGRGNWDATCGGGGGRSDFDQFTCISKDAGPTKLMPVAACGQSHWAPNARFERDYYNRTAVSSACESFRNYPFTEQIVSNLNCTAWNCTHDGFLKWWMSHFPKFDGKTPQGNLRNWWKYIVDFDWAVAEANSPPPPPPTPSSVPTPTSSPTVAPVVVTPIPTPTLIPTLSPTPTTTVTPMLVSEPTATPTIQRILGDATGDGTVDLLDFNVWKDEFLAELGGQASQRRSNFNSDNAIDLLDFNVWRDAFIQSLRI